MKIAGIRIENYKNIELAELELDSKMNIISGKNGAGKSSVIEAMIDAIKGKQSLGKNPERKINKGKDKAVIQLETNELYITRTITPKDVYLKAERIDGKPVTQTDLNNLFEESTIQITKMLHLSPKEQIDFVKEIAKIDTSEVENKYKQVYDERTFDNRMLKQKKAILDDLGEVPKVKSVDSMEISNGLQEALAKNAAITKKITRKKELRAKMDDTTLKIVEIQAALKKQEEYLKDLQRQEIEIVETEEMLIDTTEFSKKLEQADEINRQARKYAEYKKISIEVMQAKKKVEKRNDDLENLLKEREAIIANANLPFNGIEFDKNLGVVIKRIPFSEHSTAEKISIMAKIYAKQNPLLKVIYIKDGSLLDNETMKEIVEDQELGDYQFLIELVGETENSIIIREGVIVEQ